MKIYRQPAEGLNVGDCMPFSHDGTFHLYYLLDEGHHRSRGGLGGHQWAHVSTRDLVRWETHPLALSCSEDRASICTGSVFYHAGKYHAFCAIRQPDWSQHFGRAVSDDSIHFRWTEPDAVVTPPPGYARNDFRDPALFEDENGTFHLLITAKHDPFLLHGKGGCLLRFHSPDLQSWQCAGDLLLPVGDGGYCDVPECADLFAWNGWFYLLFGLGLRTYYRLARDPLGPWERPAVETLDTRFCSVMKTAAFGQDRRIGVGWCGTRSEEKDDGAMEWGGAVVYREVIQRGDGTLAVRFVPEMMPTAAASLPPDFHALTPGAVVRGNAFEIRAEQGLEVGYCDLPPGDVRIRCRVVPGEGTAAYGLGLRGTGNYERKYDLRVDCRRRLLAVAGETQPLWGDACAPGSLDVILRGSIIDVCFHDGQCLINRCYELTGNRLFFFCEDGRVRFEEVRIDRWD